MSTVDLLRNYQKDAIRFCLKNPRTYLALDMGLGKTVITLTWAANLLIRKRTKAFLVVAPIRTINSTWPTEIKKWRPELTYTILHGPDKDLNFRKNVDLYIINFEGLPWLFETLKLLAKSRGKCPFDALIIDEGSMCKSHKTKRFEFFDKMRKLFKRYRIILSGTPAPNSELDLWSQYYILDDGYRLDTSVTRYKEEYFTADWTGRKFEVKEHLKHEIHAKVADITYRLASDDHIDLPERLYNSIPIILPPKVMAKYKALEKAKGLFKIGKQELDLKSAIGRQAKLRQFVQGAVYYNEDLDYEVMHKGKLEALEELIEENSGKPLLVAIQFRFEREMILEKFPNTPVIARGTTMEQSNYYIDEWNKGNIPLILCHPASVGHGMNMQYGSNLMVWYGIPWSLELYLQLNKRLHRIGQTKTVIIHHLVTKGTVDEAIMMALGMKDMNQEKFLKFQQRYLECVHSGDMTSDEFIANLKTKEMRQLQDMATADAMRIFNAN